MEENKRRIEEEEEGRWRVKQVEKQREGKGDKQERRQSKQMKRQGERERWENTAQGEEGFQRREREREGRRSYHPLPSLCHPCQMVLVPIPPSSSKLGSNGAMTKTDI